MRQLREAGWNNVKIAEKYGICRERVRQILGGYRADLSAKANAAKEQIIAMRLEGKSIMEISRAVMLPMGYIVRLADLPRRGTKPIPHGTRGGYNRGCRCSECRATFTSWRRAYVIKKQNDNFTGLTHGRRSTYTLGCKCALCLKRGREAQRKANPQSRAEVTRRAWETRRARYGKSGLKAHNDAA